MADIDEEISDENETMGENMTNIDFFYPFDSIDGDRVVTAAVERRFWGALFNDGVVGAGGFALTQADAGVYNIAPGVAIVGGIVCGITTAKQVTAQPAAGVTLYIVLRANTYADGRTVKLTTTASPYSMTAEQMEEGGYRDLVLYSVTGQSGGGYGLLDQRTYCTSFDAQQWADQTAGAVAEIRTDGAAAVAAMESQFEAATAAINAETAGLYGAAGRQGFVNPQFLVNQRGKASYGLTSGSAYIYDRWRATVGGSAAASAVGFDTVQDGARHALSIVFPGFVAGTNAAAVALAQSIEGGVRTFCTGGRTFTVSFDAKASAARSLAVEVTQYLEAGGAYSTLAAQTVSLTTSWTRYSLTFTGTATLTAEQLTDVLKVSFLPAWRGYTTRLGADNETAGTVYLANMQINEGSQALACYARSYADELEACQRYYVALGYVTLPVGAPLASTNQVITGPVPLARRLYRVPDVASTDRVDAAGYASAEVAAGGWRHGLAHTLSGNSTEYPVFVVTNTDASAVTRVCFNSLALDAEIAD